MSDASNNPPPTSWFQGLDAEVQQHVAAKGWDKLEPAAAALEAAKSHYGAQKLIGVPPEQVVRLPKDATDPTYQGIYDRVVGMATPKTAEEYTFDGVKFKDGSDLDEGDVKFIREVSAKYKLPIHVARGLALDLATRTEANMAEGANSAETAKAANNVALRTAWGGEYDQKTFAVSKVGEVIGFTPEVLEAMAKLPAEKYIANMNAMAKLSAELNEATILRGGSPVRNPDAGLDAASAQARLDALKDDKAWGAKYLAGDAEARATFDQLTTIIARARADGMTVRP